MRILFDFPFPFSLARGGMQVQIERTMAALRDRGVEVEPLKWWCDDQSADVLHYFGRPDSRYVQLARACGMRVVMSELLGGVSEKSRLGQVATIWGTRIFAMSGNRMFTRMGWTTYDEVDAAVALTDWEAGLMKRMFRVSDAKLHVVPNGVEEVFFEAGDATLKRGKWLVCTGVIQPRKRQLELAKLAITAGTPIWFVGTSQNDTAEYFEEFARVAAANPEVVRWEGAVIDRIELASIYAAARGFVLLSGGESLSLAALEAAAAGCPLLLSDLPWARSYFGRHASYCPLDGAKTLREFYDNPRAPGKELRLLRWSEVADELLTIYQQLRE